MHTRAKALERMRSLYGLLSHSHELALHHASAAVHDVETHIKEHSAMVKRSSDESLTALCSGDQLGWQMYESQRKSMERDATQLLALRRECEEQAQKAEALYQAQRIQFEQMKSVMDSLRTRLALEHTRREQQDADDRFLTRQRWLERRETQRMNHS